VGRINRGDGDGGEPARSPSGQSSFRWPTDRTGVPARIVAAAGTPGSRNHRMPPVRMVRFCASGATQQGPVDFVTVGVVLIEVNSTDQAAAVGNDDDVLEHFPSR
jgi:hypothetical protein